MKSVDGYNSAKCLSAINVDTVDKSIRSLNVARPVDPITSVLNTYNMHIRL